ncbi:MAG: GTP pyrophosphokinase family protein [Lachnospiraceae bacterium]|nr:GTP pyrophosphokinase family protein [Lachnospiraceae bacterium]
MTVYGGFEERLNIVAAGFMDAFERQAEAEQDSFGNKPYDHLSMRIKSEESMLKKCEADGLQLTPHNALKVIHDSIGVRVVCLFPDDIKKNAELIRQMSGVTVIREKDYIREAKPNGYRSYHMIVEVPDDRADVDGNLPGRYFIEVQLRTIAMDTWAALEHELKYKQNIKNPELIAVELKRCADELAACDVSMQTIRDLIRS